MRSFDVSAGSVTNRTRSIPADGDDFPAINEYLPPGIPFYLIFMLLDTFACWRSWQSGVVVR